jgi:hypothetical protein
MYKQIQFNKQQTLVSIYWDYQNIRNPNVAKQLLLFANSLGGLCNKKIYSNWQYENKDSKTSLINLGFNCVDVSQPTKNSVDFKLTFDCASELGSNTSAKIFILVTGDGDYETLVRELRSKGRQVIVFYKPVTVNKKLIQNADKSYSVDELLDLLKNKAHSDDLQTHITYKEAINCLIAAIKAALKQGKPTRFELIDSLMRSNQGCSNYRGVSSIRKPDGTTFGKFSKFVAAVVEEGKVQVRAARNFKELFLIEKDRQST